MEGNNTLHTQIVAFFRENQGKFFSVSKIAEQFNARRNTIHYHLKKLKEDNFLGQNSEGEYYFESPGNPYGRPKLRTWTRLVIAGGVFLAIGVPFLFYSFSAKANPASKNYSGLELIINNVLAMTFLITSIVSLLTGLVLLVAGLIKKKRTISINTERFNGTDQGMISGSEQYVPSTVQSEAISDDVYVKLASCIQHVYIPFIISNITWLTWPWLGKVYHNLSKELHSIKIKGTEKELSGAARYFAFASTLCVFIFGIYIASFIFGAYPIIQSPNDLISNIIIFLIMARDIFNVVFIVNLRRAWKRIRAIFTKDIRHPASIISSIKKVLTGSLLSLVPSIWSILFDVPLWASLIVLTKIFVGINPYHKDFITEFIAFLPFFIISMILEVLFLIGIIIQARAMRDIVKLASGKSIIVKVGSMNLVISPEDAAHVAKEITDKLAIDKLVNDDFSPQDAAHVTKDITDKVVNGS